MLKVFFILLSLNPLVSFAEHILSIGRTFNTRTNSGETRFTTNINSNVGGIDSKYETATSFGYEYRELGVLGTQQSGEGAYLGWGYAAGFRYNTRAEIEEQQFRGDLGGISPTLLSRPSLQTTELYLNAIYSWRIFYIPFGLSYSIYREETPSSFSGSTDAENGFGFNIGLGMHLGQMFGLELGFTRTKFSITSSQSAVPPLGSVRTFNDNYRWRAFNIRLLCRF